MYRRLLAALIATGCLLVALACGAGAWGIHRGLVEAPTGTVQLGGLEVISYTELHFSPGHPPRAYYTIWVTFHNGSVERVRAPALTEWTQRLFQLEVPAPMVVGG
jgi:hypothetical protein